MIFSTKSAKKLSTILPQVSFLFHNIVVISHKSTSFPFLPPHSILTKRLVNKRLNTCYHWLLTNNTAKKLSKVASIYGVNKPQERKILPNQKKPPEPSPWHLTLPFFPLNTLLPALFSPVSTFRRLFCGIVRFRCLFHLLM